jgi:hypothetical protein
MGLPSDTQFAANYRFSVRLTMRLPMDFRQKGELPGTFPWENDRYAGALATPRYNCPWCSRSALVLHADIPWPQELRALSAWPGDCVRRKSLRR